MASKEKIIGHVAEISKSCK